MLEEKQPGSDPSSNEQELTDADLDLVSGGDNKPVVKPKPKPTTTSGAGGFLHIDGVAGESMDDKHKDWIE